MRVLLISANSEQINMPAPPLGLILVAAATRRAGREVTFLGPCGQAEPEVSVQRAIKAGPPGVVGISVRSIDDQDTQSRRFPQGQSIEPTLRLLENPVSIASEAQNLGRSRPSRQ